MNFAMFCKFSSVFCFTSLLVMSISAYPTGEADFLRDRRSPILGLLGLKGQHHGQPLGGHYGGPSGHYGGDAFSGSSAQASASSSVGHGLHGASGSHSFASSHSQSSSYGMGPYNAGFPQSHSNAGASAGGRHEGYGAGGHF